MRFFTFELFLDRSRTELCVSTVKLSEWIARDRRCNVRKAVFTIFLVSIIIAPSFAILLMFFATNQQFHERKCCLLADYIIRSPLPSANRVQIETDIIFWFNIFFNFDLASIFPFVCSEEIILRMPPCIAANKGSRIFSSASGTSFIFPN